jgi:acyl-CoA synthetase (AMP-forming)/AMP-acid ligase II
LHSAIDLNLTRFEHRVAFVFDGIAWSYAQLDAGRASVAEILDPHIAKGELLALQLSNCPQFLTTCLASFQLGLVPMPLYGEAKPAELLTIMDAAQCRNLVLDTQGWQQLQSSGMNTGSLKNVWTIDAGGLQHVIRRERSPAPPSPHIANTALVLHSSGTSGKPKGIQLSATSLDCIIAGRIEAAGIDGNSRTVVASALSHSVGLYQALALLATGGQFVLLPSYALPPMVAAVNEYRPSHLIIVVKAFDDLLQHPGITRESLSTVKFAAVGADQVTPQVQQRYSALTGRNLAVSYGMSELSWILLNDGRDSARCLALGKPTTGVQVKLLNSDGDEVEPGTLGEIHARSPKAMLGYLYNTQLTAETLHDGWISSGDLAWQDSEGYYWFSARSHDVIVLNTGDLVSPREVEHSILEISGITECVVVGMQDTSSPGGTYSEVPWAFVKRRNRHTRAEDILHHLSTYLSDYKLPREIHFLESLPLNSNGKISRQALRQQFQTVE